MKKCIELKSNRLSILLIILMSILLGVCWVIVSDEEVVSAEQIFPKIEAMEAADISNLSDRDFEYLCKLCNIYIEKNPKATEAQIDIYLQAEMLRMSKEASKPSVFSYGNIYDNLKPGEKDLFFKHPFKSATAKACADKANSKTTYFYKSDKNFHMDNGDAFRHGYWNALMTVSLGAD